MLGIIAVPKFFQFVACLVGWFLLTQCATTPDVIGQQPNFASYVPARAAVLPCRAWPKGARFKDYELPNITKADQTQLCAAFDAAVLSAFANQPFMQGFTPALVHKMLVNADATGHLGWIDNLWQTSATGCVECESALKYYSKEVKDRPNWNAWLSRLTEIVRNCDAVLIPFILNAKQEITKDRGMYKATRTVRVLLMLVDSNSARLIWTGTREASLETTAYDHPTPEYPQWDDLSQRIFTEFLWLDYPGRLIH